MERLEFYVEHDQERQAQALVELINWLEDCAAYELTFEPPEVY